MRHMRPILFVHNRPQHFVVTDHKLLQECWPVEEHYVQRTRLNPLPVTRGVLRCSLVFCWFASWHSLLPVFLARLFNKPSGVVVGGYDTANVAEANYGSQRGGVRRQIARTIMSLCTQLLAFSESARCETIANACADPNKIALIYLGVEPLAMGPLADREPLVLTIGQVWRENLLRKGLLPFVETARLLPEAQFVHVGRWCDDSINDLRAAAPSNVQFAGFVSDDEMQTLCQRASVYVQASIHEGFGLSLAEAMTAGCIPVVTSAGSLPEVVGSTGVYTRSNKPIDLADAIRSGLAWDGIKRQQARDRILKEFPVERRRAALHAVIDRLLVDGTATVT